MAQREQELLAEAKSVEAAAAAAEQVASRQREEEEASRQREEEVRLELRAQLRKRVRAKADRFRQERAEQEQASRQREEEEQRSAAEQVFQTWFQAIKHARKNKWDDLADLLQPVAPRRRKEIMLRPLDAEDSAVGFRSHLGSGCGQREVRVGSG